MATSNKAKPWFAEREFIFTVAAAVGGVALIIQGHILEGSLLLGITTSGYSLSRGNAKRTS